MGRYLGFQFDKGRDNSERLHPIAHDEIDKDLQLIRRGIVES